ncbi:hypothetical protein GPJ56_008052 [Histomonas meleagridis]|uniref:uncharacterized protein n=1 Tax=Histomonas meleagridis TaxID=135588 RepID=UPI0035595155|nr:hypothetical protein GPJ56_008052 [Histomonas meleagridis]KAH0800318.1 hypothetical protein GO595_006907 [Histomonas meleagridis]
MSFETIFGFYSFPKGTYYMKSVVAKQPSTTVDPSSIYEEIYQNFMGPKNFIKTLNELLRNHTVRRNPIHFIDFSVGLPPQPIFDILPKIVSSEVIFAQAHQPLVTLNDYLTPWQHFAFECFYQYMEILLSNGSLYKDQARQWLLENFYSHLTQDKTPYNKHLILHIRNPNSKNPLTVFFSSRSANVSIYNGAKSFGSGKISYQTHKNVEETIFTDKTTNSSTKITPLSSDGKVIEDKFNEILNKHDYLELVIWSCETLHKQQGSYPMKAIDFLGKMFTGVDGYFAQALILSMDEISPQNDKLLTYLTNVALFFRRHLFILKVAVWNEMELIKTPEELFQKQTVTLNFLVNIMHKTSKDVIDRILDKVCSVASSYNNSELETEIFVARIFDSFWVALIENCCSFPSIVFDLCRYVFICTFKKFGNEARNPYIGVNTLFFVKLIVPALMDRFNTSDPIRKTMVLVTHAISQTATQVQQTTVSIRGQQSLSMFLSKITGKYEGKVDMELPPIEKYIKSVQKLIEYTVEHATKLKQSLKNPQWRWKIIEELLFSYFIKKKETN